MEPTDIDSIIKGKLRGANDAHQHELEAAKPFVWAAI